MDDRSIVFIDSGSGSFPYGEYFNHRNPKEKLICLADKANFPYGSKSRVELIDILTSLVELTVHKYNPKIIALICNSASVSALDHLCQRFPLIPFVGTVPAIKPALKLSVTGRIGVLATERTVDDHYIDRLAEISKKEVRLVRIAAPELIEFVQARFAFASDDERLEAVKPWVEKFRAENVDTIVLGCTHFLLLKKEFLIAAAGINIVDSLDGVCRRLEFILDSDSSKLRAPPRGEAEKMGLAITGSAPLEEYWQKMASLFDFKIERMA